MWLWLFALALGGDIDGDAIDDAVDNCLYASNADQADSNGDGYGDACADPTATLGSNVIIARDVTISAGAVIGDDVVLLRRAYIGVDAVVGDGAIIRGRLKDAAAQGPARVLAQGLLVRGSVVASGAEVGIRATCSGRMDEGSTLAADAVLGGHLGPFTQVGERSVVRARVASQSTLGSDVRSAGRLGHRVTVHDGARIARGARIGDDSVIGAGAVVGPRSELGQRAQVGADARVRSGVEVEDDVSVGEGAVLRRNTDVPAGASIVAGTVSGPGLATTSGSEVCVDGLDNDADSLVDCLDADCASHFACATETACADGQDNDYDGRIDCADRDCTGQADCPGESDCTDGLDNNNSGAADCSDPTCFGAPGCTVELLCDDGLDNDGDGYTDLQQHHNGRIWQYTDPDCGLIPEYCRGFGTEDGDGDGLVWPVDPDCFPWASELCNNGVDDDANGLVDCEDAACASAAMCVENCVDGLDNDLDGDADCADDDCLGQVCLAERRISGGVVYVEDRESSWTTFNGVEGGGCVGSVSRLDYRFDRATMSVTMDTAEIRLQVPTTLGGFSSSTCIVDQAPMGIAYAPLGLEGQVVQMTPVPTSLLVIEQRRNLPTGRVSSDCNWPEQAREAAHFAVKNAAHFERDVGGQPVVLNGLGPWDVGVPSYWVTESLAGSETFSSRADDNCWGLGMQSGIHHSAEWDLPAQTHTFLPPEP